MQPLDDGSNIDTACALREEDLGDAPPIRVAPPTLVLAWKLLPSLSVDQLSIA